MKPTTLIIISFMAILTQLMMGGCERTPQPEATVDSVMSELVTFLYDELDEHELESLTASQVLQYLTTADREVLSTAYWQFEVNVPVIVSIMRDSAQQQPPFWLEDSGFKKTEMVVRNRLSTYEVWQAEYAKGEIGLGINGFDRHRPVYFVGIGPKNPGDKLEITPVFPQTQYIGVLDTGSFTYHDWDGLVLSEVPETLRGQNLLTTIRGRAREAHVLGAFRTTEFPSGEMPDQITLTLPDDPRTGMTVQWRANASVNEGSVRYWLEGGLDTFEVRASQVMLEDRQLRNDRYVSRMTAQLKGLQEAKNYQYVVGNDGFVSDTLCFKTAGNDGEFSFIWTGDVHNDPLTGALFHTAHNRHPESAFYILAGDLVNTGLYRNDWDNLFGYSGNVFGHKPLMGVPGNHDSQDGLGASMYQQLLRYPHNGPQGLSPGLTYAFHYENALFVMADIVSFSAKEQREWIAEQLANTEATWKFVVFHFPPYTNQEPYIDIEKEWTPLFDQYHVNIVMNGHFHYYLRTMPMKGGEVSENAKEGTTYIMSVGTSSKNKDVNWEPYAAKRANQGYLYQYVNIEGGKLTHTSLDGDGNVIDSFEITQ